MRGLARRARPWRGHGDPAALFASRFRPLRQSAKSLDQARDASLIEADLRDRPEASEPVSGGRSERVLRPSAVYRNITNGFRSEWGATLYPDIRSVVETARRRSIRTIDAIRLTLQAKPIPRTA
jgi:hypothetical protein